MLDEIKRIIIINFPSFVRVVLAYQYVMLSKVPQELHVPIYQKEKRKKKVPNKALMRFQEPPRSRARL